MQPSSRSPPRRPLAVALVLAAAAAAAAEPAPGQRERSARAVAEHHPDCVAVQPFYWSIGDAAGLRIDGRTGAGAPAADTPMAIASASKWVYGAYVVQKKAARLDARDVRFLTFVSGYTDFSRCLRGQTVGGCDAWRENGRHEPADDGLFYYGGGHMQRHATIDGESNDDDAALAARVNAALGTTFTYTQPQPAGGIRASAADYGRFLQRIVSGRLLMREALGTHAVCTNPATCPTAAYTPMAHDESPHYAIGHWVEDDPVHGDGAYSSAGAFGFYPWISHDKAWWGVLARVDWHPGAPPGAGVRSLYCGRRIRAAWLGEPAP